MSLTFSLSHPYILANILHIFHNIPIFHENIHHCSFLFDVKSMIYAVSEGKNIFTHMQYEFDEADCPCQFCRNRSIPIMEELSVLNRDIVLFKVTSQEY